MIDINLLPSKDLLTAAERLWRLRLIQAAVALGTVVIVGLIIVLGLGQAAHSRAANLSRQRETLLVSFNNDTAKLEMLLALKDKIAGIKRVKAVRPNLSAAITIEQGLLVDGVATTKLAVDSNGAMGFDVTVRDVNALSSYLNKLASGDSQGFFKRLTIRDVKLGRDSGFSFSIATDFDKSKLILE